MMSQIPGEKVITNVQASPAIEFMADECTHISITKELILYACILCGSEVHACFLKIDIRDGKAETIEKAILSYLSQRRELQLVLNN